MIYLVATLNFVDQASYRRYERAFPAVFARFQARLLAADEQPITLEGSASVDKVVILEFANEAEAHRFVTDPDYKAISVDRQLGARCHVLQVAAAVGARDKPNQRGGNDVL